MANDYLCPSCKSHMRVEDAFVFGVKSKEGERGIVFLHPELGNYTKTTHPSFKLIPGQDYNFYCPACHARLNTKDNPNLVMVHMSDSSGTVYELYISNIIDEKCTYKVQDKVVEAYGPDEDRYKKYFDLSPEYKKYL